jgi:hypothetical protein
MTQNEVVEVNDPDASLKLLLQCGPNDEWMVTVRKPRYVQKNLRR